MVSSRTRHSLHERLGLSEDTIQAVLIFAVPVMLCFFFVDRPLRFALCAAAILGPITSSRVDRGRRSTPSGASSAFSRSSEMRPLQHRLVHGTRCTARRSTNASSGTTPTTSRCSCRTRRGTSSRVAGANQAFNPRQEPLTYYHRTGPVGAMFREVYTRKDGADREGRRRDGRPRHRERRRATPSRASSSPSTRSTRR